MRKYIRAEAEFVSLSPAEEITITLEEISNPFDAAVAEDEAAEEAARQAAK